MTQASAKCWGFDIAILEKPHFQLHEIQFKKGGVCSEHLHEHRYNLFYVIRGQLRIRVWDSYDEDKPPSVIDLTPLQMTIVPPGVFHQFEGMTDGAAIEAYWVDDPDPRDILRRSEGFRRPPSEVKVELPGEVVEGSKPLVH
jgi:mannose-6-phosphate isomerase-like protein (cupin superfamily)